ncbi:MAG: sterol desaturase family protein [Acidimicrobiia bacterium]
MSLAATIAIAIAALLLMEPFTALVHRFVMHGFGMGWHRSHHEPPQRQLEANDLFPVAFSVLTIAALCVGLYVPGYAALVPVGVGVTAYGAAYLFVHDVVIHRRVPGLPVPAWLLARWRDAHNVHHLYARAPYGFLAPVVPAGLRGRAAGWPDRTPRTITAPE